MVPASYAGGKCTAWDRDSHASAWSARRFGRWDCWNAAIGPRIGLPTQRTGPAVRLGPCQPPCCEEFVRRGRSRQAGDGVRQRTGPLRAALERPHIRANAFVGPGIHLVHDERIQHQTFDVTPGLVGIAEITPSERFWVTARRVLLWHAAKAGSAALPGQRGFILRLEIDLADGTTRSIVTDGTWRSTRNSPDPIQQSLPRRSLQHALKMPGWDSAGFDDQSLGSGRMVHRTVGRRSTVWQRNEPIRVVKDLAAAKMTEPKPRTSTFSIWDRTWSAGVDSSRTAQQARP